MMEYLKTITVDFFTINPIVLLVVSVCIVVIIFVVVIEIIKKIREGEKMKYEFITIIAHKFQTPMSKVKWIADTMIVDETDSYKKEYLMEIKKANENLIGLTGALIDMTDSDDTAKSAYNFESINICDLIKKTTDNMKSIYKERNIFFAVSYSQEEILVKADRARLEFVISSILNNAFIFTPIGKKIDGYVVTHGSRVTFTLVDNGIGISSSELPKIGTKFYRGQKARSIDTEGFGVSLYLSDSIMRRHKGNMTIDSEGAGKGTTVSMTLPIVRK